MKRKEFLRKKADFCGKWAVLIADLADGGVGEADDVDLGVGLAMAVAVAQRADKGQNYDYLISRAKKRDYNIEELVKDAKELYPNRFK